MKCKNTRFSWKILGVAMDRVYGGLGGHVPPTFGQGEHNIVCPPQHFVVKSNVVVQIPCYFTVGNVSPA